MGVDELVGLLFRWLHIGSAIFLLGGALYFRLAVAPAAAGLPAEQAGQLYDAMATRIRAWVWTACIALVVAGFYNFFVKASHVPRGYHMWFGIKFLLALHLISISLLAARAGVEPAKRQRWMSGAMITGLCIVAISGYLRWLAG
jgi:uncharacterized membrane protein